MLPPNRQTLTALYQDGMSKMSSGRIGPAQEAFRRILGHLPDQPEANFQLARIAKAQGDLQAAADHIALALTKKPDEKALLQLAAELNAETGNQDAAKAAYEKLIALSPGDLKTQADLAHFLQLAGATDEAEKLFRRLIKKHPYQSELYRMFVGTAKLKPGDPVLKSMQKAITHPKMSDGGKVHLGFAMAKVMEDIGQTKKVFSYLTLANRLQAKAFPFNVDTRDTEIDTVLNAQLSPPARLPEASTPTPIFVTGMPRSGTTLVERIFASHSQVVAGGENPAGMRLMQAHFGLGPGMKKLPDLSSAQLQAFANDYLRTIKWRADSANASFVTDKAITSFMFFGYLTAAMPNAKLIVVHRDPRDIALSIYKNHFADGTHRYSTDLRHIAGMIKAFRRAIDVWKTRMPGRIHEVQYEDLVTDPEPQTKALISAAGLEWDPACLTPNASGGQIKTLSVAQARQPIYTKSKQAWKKYEAEMAPFIEAWEAD